jgi:tetratricopeptide (TPR) repeat protein
MRTLCASVLLAFSTGAGFAQVPDRHAHGGHGPAGLGVVEFPNSGAKAAQPAFLRGLALLHSFEYEEAAESFAEARKLDPKFALAYYFEAFSHSHVLWGIEDLPLSRETLARLGPNSAARLKATPAGRERDYAAAFEAFFADESLPERLKRFAAATVGTMNRYPDDVEAQAFASLALLLKAFDGELSPAQRAAARDSSIAIAERIFKTHPKHPGGTHYLIHSTDDPSFAARGLAAARAYAEVAPEAEHALHMPSHIFLQLGLWDDVVASNERAWAASRAEVVARKLPNTDLSFHALSWLQYGYLQQGRYQAARAVIDTARAVLADVDFRKDNYGDAQYTIGDLEFVQASITGEWTEPACARARDFRYPETARSMREQSFQNLAVYQAAISGIMCGVEHNAALGLVRSPTASNADPRTLPYRRAAEHADALIALRTADFAKAIALLTTAAAAPATPPVGPVSTLRTHELLGEALLKAGRAKEAVAAYERALQLTPRRSVALLGLARAHAAVGNTRAAATAYKDLLESWKNADVGLPELAEARAGSIAN